MQFFGTYKGKILATILFLLIIGSVNVFSASTALATATSLGGTSFLLRYALFAFLGLLACFILSQIRYQVWLSDNMQISIAAMLLALLFVVHFFGATENGAKRWILMGGFSLQPSELVKVGAILIMTAYLAPLIQKKQPASLFSPQFISILVMGGLVYKQPDLGTAAIIVGLALCMICICGLPRWQYLLMGITTLSGIYYLTFAASYRAARVKAWLDPWSYQTTDSYQTVQSFFAIGSGGLTGMGFGQGVSKLFYLPEAHTDFAFAVLCQETGFIGAILLIAAFLYLCLLLAKLARDTQDAHAFFFFVGLNLLITGQAVANMAMVTGLLPVIGVPLPFISYGGTSLLSLLCALGIVLNVLSTRRAIRVQGDEQPPERIRPSRLAKATQPESSRGALPRSGSAAALAARVRRRSRYANKK